MKTETASPRYRALDTWSSEDILETMLEGQMAAVAAVAPALPAIAAAADAAAERLARGGRLIYVGAGTSGRIGVQDGVELTPTFNWPKDRLIFLLAGGDLSLMESIEGAEDDSEAAEREIVAAGIGKDDVVLGLAASGGTPYTVAALRRARALGALTIGVANNAGTAILEASAHPVLLDTGAEIIAGSTRMKAGTAQKAMLNLFSSLLMIRLGRVYEGQMVDMQASNKKLVLRSERMLRQLTGCGSDAARAALEKADGNVKLAILILRGRSPEEARTALAAAGGHLRKALEG
ncbi:N-acetylmuramic acid 6-phosphate etherase [Inquilinus sp. CAU 1745]|uniref:N-acetylmuramic acid 6-phosphate etherase n=1 Tax=Inquilinus sp. CAU 1745 TaxID=3140369 RepID=UPI00325B029C